MSFTLKNTMSFLAMASLTVAARSSLKKRATSDLVMYAYGTNITGLPVFMSSDLAYIGNMSFQAVPDFLTDATYISWTTERSSTTTPWNVTSSSTDSSDTSQFYIDTTTGAFSQAGFYNPASGEALGDGLTNTGFTYMGREVAYAASDSDYQEKFWAQQSNTTGIWSLMWNVDGALQTDSVPVVLKTTAPLSIQ